MDIYEHHDWSRIEALVKTWPGATRIAPDALEGYMSALVYPNGRDRGARTDDPLELEATLLELIQEDREGKRPPIGVVVARLGLRRARRHASLEDVLTAEYTSEPAADWVVAHAVARDTAIAPLMVAVARRHGRDVAPPHDETTCELCIVSRLEAATELELSLEYGSEWRKIGAALEALEASERVLDERFPWRVLP